MMRTGVFMAGGVVIENRGLLRERARLLLSAHTWRYL
jgi:hypothetical protein